ncbi:MAG: hypothetical protein JWN84_3517 [Nocardioides sp.]|nr:hypothetical protein [Nocardioides sp.]
MSRDVDVLVVGAGHLGLATALGLARAGVTVRVLDTVPAPRLATTAVHHWSVLSAVAGLGVLDDVLAIGHRTSTWGLCVPATGEHLTYDLADLADEVAHPFNLRIEEPALRDVLREALVALPGASYHSDVRIASLHEHPGGFTVEVEDLAGGTELVRAQWLVAADGTTSVVRRALGLGFEGTTWTERCVVALVEHDLTQDPDHPDTTFVVDSTRGAVVERVDDRRWRYLYLEPLRLAEESVGDRVPLRLRGATGAEPRLLDWTSTRMHQRSTPSFRAGVSGRALLVGEAAHVTHHLIGHTSICGWFDAVSAATVLAEVVGATTDDVALTRWADDRRRVFLDDAVPASLSRKNLLTQIDDPRRLDVELDQFRRAVGDVDVRREVLRQGRELEGLHPVL